MCIDWSIKITSILFVFILSNSSLLKTSLKTLLVGSSSKRSFGLSSNSLNRDP